MTRARVLTLAISIVLLAAVAVAGAVVRQTSSGDALPRGKAPKRVALDAVPAADTISVAQLADHSDALAMRVEMRRAAQEAAEAAALKAAQEAAAQQAAQEAAQKAAQEAAAQKAAQEAAAQRAAQQAAAQRAAQQAAAQRAASGSIPDIITAAFSPLGSGAVSWALRVARCESGYNPNAVNASSGAAGLFQFLRSTWAGTPYAASSPFDPVANARAAAWLYVHGGPGNWQCK